MTIIWLLLLIHLKFLLVLGIYNIQKIEKGWAIGSFTLSLSISLKATSHLHLAHKASVTLEWTTVVEKVDPGTLGHVDRTLGPSMPCLGYLAFSAYSHSALILLFPVLFSTHIFSLLCINLHLFARSFVNILKFFFPSHMYYFMSSSKVWAFRRQKPCLWFLLYFL